MRTENNSVYEPLSAGMTALNLLAFLPFLRMVAEILKIIERLYFNGDFKALPIK